MPGITKHSPLLLRVLMILFVSLLASVDTCKPRNASSANTTTTDSLPRVIQCSLEPFGGTFKRTSERKQLGIDGSEDALVYSSSSGSLYLYKRYYVIIAKEAPSNNDIVVVFRRHGVSSADSISISASDTMLVTLTDFGLWFFGLKENHFFIDRGTGPDPRGLVVIDLATQDTVLETMYASDDIYLDSLSNVIYYAPSARAKESDCPEYKKWIAEGFSPYIEEKLAFNLLTRTERKLGKTRCVAYQ